jgi:DNA-binding MarR family transcriptional regulator
MEDGLVQDCNQILCLLLKEKTSVNKIIYGTSLHKKRVFIANDFLEKTKFIDRTKDSEHKQKVIVSLTDFGKYFARLIVNFEKFEESLKKFLNSAKQFNKYVNMDEDARRNLLAIEKWSKYEIENYLLHLEYVNCHEIDYLDIMLNVIENIYAVFLLKFNPNKDAKDYLNKLISDKFVYYLQSKFDKTITVNDSNHCKICEHDNTYQISTKQKIDEMYKEMGERLFDGIDDGARFLLNHKLISTEVKGVIYSTFDLIDFPKEYIEHKIDEEKSVVNLGELDNKSIENIKPFHSFLDSFLRRV